MSKKIRMDSETKKMFGELIKKSPQLKIMQNGKPLVIKLTLKGHSCIAANYNGGKDLSGQPFKPDTYYVFEVPGYVNVKNLLESAYRKNGTEGMITQYHNLIELYKKQQETKPAQSSSESQ